MHVYIVECRDTSYYTGVTNNVERRIHEHNAGIDPDCYTYRRRPVVLRFYETFQEPLQAIAFEKTVKGWSRKKKEAIIAGRWDYLPELARCLNETSHTNHSRPEENDS